MRGEISQEAEKEMAMSTDENSLSIPSRSLYSTCTAWSRGRLELYKPVIMMLDLTSMYICTQKHFRIFHLMVRF